MATPDTLTTMVREVLVKWIAPGPKIGYSWCVRCSLNGGRTLVLNAGDETLDHLEAHRDVTPMGMVRLISKEKTQHEPSQ